MVALLPNFILNFLCLLFEALTRDLENFFSSVQESLRTLEKFWREVIRLQTSRAGDSQCSESCNNGESCGRELGRLSASEVNLVMNRLGMGQGNNKGVTGLGLGLGFGPGDFASVFEEEEPSLEEIKETFGVFDVNKDGYIDASELRRVVSKLGLNCELEECERMIAGFDSNGGGLVDFQDFLKLMEKSLC